MIGKASKNETIEVYIGARTADSVPYTVPKNILCRHRYFRNALSPPFSEGQTRILHFPEYDENRWEVLIYYFFSDRVEWSEMEETSLHSDVDLLTLTNAHVLADKYGLPALQNKIAKAMMSGVMLEVGSQTSTMKDALTILSVNSPLR